MRIEIITTGKRPPAWVAEGWRDYHQRIPPEYKIELIELPAGAAREKHKRLEQESARINKAVSAGAIRVALDENGKMRSSRTLASDLSDWRDQSRGLSLIIGGPDGLARTQLEQAEHRWSLGAATLPHALVRVILIEQLYRAMSILAGHPYHRD